MPSDDDLRFVPVSVAALDQHLLTADPCGAVEAVLAAVEARFPVRVTIHDRSGVLHDSAGRSLFNTDRTSHQHPFCRAGRNSSNTYNACLAHCQDAVNARAGEQAQAFVHHCWKGGSEVVVPLWRHGVHLATLFAGVLRGEHTPPAQWQRFVNDLQQMEGDGLIDLAAALTAAGDALLATIERLKACEGEGTRAGLIRRFLHYHAHRDICLADLAHHLGLSPWHCSRVVARTLGKPFGDLLTDERLERAAGLLRATDRSVGAIAQLVGFTSQHHFNRAFKTRFGKPPGVWRRQVGKG